MREVFRYRIRIFICTLFTLVSLIASAVNTIAIIDGITWRVAVNDGYVSVGTSSETAVSKETKGSLVIPSYILGLPVVSIGEGAFRDCIGLTRITIPDSVVDIRASAFAGCNGLTSLTIHSVKSIGAFAFQGCSKLTAMEIPKSVTNIAYNAFRCCSSMLAFSVDDRNQFYKSVSGLLLTKDGTKLIAGVNGDVTIPEGVTDIGSYAFYECSDLTSVTMPSSVTNIGEFAFRKCSILNTFDVSEYNPCYSSVNGMLLSKDGATLIIGVNGVGNIPDCVTSIGQGAFCDCVGLTSVSIGNCVTNIGKYAFRDCINLKSVAISDSVEVIEALAFDGCSNLIFDTSTISNVKLIDGWAVGYTDLLSGDLNLAGVRGIEDSAFYNCSGLTSIAIPDSVKRIGDYAFAYCSGITSVTIGGSETSIGNNAFFGCNNVQNAVVPGYTCGVPFDGVTNLVILAGTTSIKDSAFIGCSGLTSVTIPDSVKCIENNAFSGCSGLTSIAMPDSIASIGSRAFYNCSGLSIVNIPDSVTNIGESAFSCCSNLRIVTIPNSVRSIDANAFYKCNSLSGVYISDLVCWCNVSFADGYSNPLYYAHDLYLNEELLVDLKVPRAVTYIGDYAFYQCNKLTSVNLPESVESIGESAFKGCTALTNITLPNSVFSIGKYAFMNCSSLASVIISENLTSIERGLFEGCTELSCITIPNSVTNISWRAFWGCSGLTNVTIGEGVVNIGGYAFCNCSNISKIVIPNSVADIGESVFSGCSGLTSMTLPFVGSCRGNSGSSESSFGHIFGGLSFSGGIETKAYYSSWRISWFYIPLSLKEVVINDEIVLGGGAFYNCSMITSVSLPSSIIDVGQYAFYGCKGLKQILLSSDCHVDSTAIPSTMALTRYKVNQHVSLDAATGMVNPTALSVTYGDIYGDLPAPSRVGYVFDYWALDGLVVSNDTVVTALDDHTLVAHWTANKYVVTFDANGGEGGWSEALDYEGLIEAPIVVREGYTFVGWDRNISVVPINGVICTAQWEVNQYTVAFDANGGEGGKVETLDYGSVIAAPVVTRIGYTFDGWSSEVAATVPAYDVAYKAQWMINSYKVRFDAQGGVIDEGERYVDYNDTVGELPMPVKDGAEFFGWWTEPDGGERVDETMVVTDAKTVYAHWLCEVAAPVVSPGDGTVFKTDSREVSITCETEGTTIYYSTTGKTPKMTDSYLYSGPFTITDSATIIAVAVFGKLKTEYVTVNITKKLLTLEDALDASDLIVVETSDENPWVPILDDGAKGGDGVARSAAIGDGCSTWLTATVEGSGTLSFWCKVSCEQDDGGIFTWDRLEVYTNNVPVCELFMDGNSDWVSREVAFSSGVNTVKWMYCKDEDIAAGEDCAWLDAVVWTPTVVLPTVAVDGEKMDAPVVDAESGKRVIAAKEGQTLTEEDVASVTISSPLDSSDITEAYVKTLVDNQIIVELATPAVESVEEEDKDENDPSGMLANVELEQIEEKPDPKEGEEVGALPVKTYPGLYYQASWGDDLGGLKTGEKVQATGEKLYLGVIKQTGDKGFYKLSVSEE